MSTAVFAGEGAEPFGDAQFARAMLDFAPYEDNPVLAVALSGGGDSLALCLLADAWVRRRGGRVVALTVDHGLRATSADEARRVAAWMRQRRIEHHILQWTGAKPPTRLQQEARDARYRLLRGWCGAHGVLHLLVAHTREDQAETVLLRRQKGSGVHGLAGMSACLEFPEVRLLRPLLDTPRRRLRGSLEAAGQEWIEDPSNRDPRFARVRVRRSLGEEGVAEACRTARRCGAERQAAERLLARLAAVSLSFGIQGYARVALPPLREAPADLRGRFWGGVLAAVGGRPFAPEAAALESLDRWLQDKDAAGSRTLGRCRIVVTRGAALVVREMRNLPPPRPLRRGEDTRWDGRFAVVAGEPCQLAAVGSAGWAEIAPRPAAPKTAVLPLPALHDGEGIVEVSPIGYRRMLPPAAAAGLERCIFSPPNAVSGIGFFLASENSAIISCSAGVTSPGAKVSLGGSCARKDRP